MLQAVIVTLQCCQVSHYNRPKGSNHTNSIQQASWIQKVEAAKDLSFFFNQKRLFILCTQDSPFITPDILCNRNNYYKVNCNTSILALSWRSKPLDPDDYNTLILTLLSLSNIQSPQGTNHANFIQQVSWIQKVEGGLDFKRFFSFLKIFFNQKHSSFYVYRFSLYNTTICNRIPDHKNMQTTGRIRRDISHVKRRANRPQPRDCIDYGNLDAGIQPSSLRLLAEQAHYLQSQKSDRFMEDRQKSCKKITNCLITQQVIIIFIVKKTCILKYFNQYNQ